MSSKRLWRWAVAVTTAPRPQETLSRTLASLKSGGWDQPLIAEDTERLGQFVNWRRALRLLLEREPLADAYFMLEDDVVLCRALRSYLEWSLWPDATHRLALCSVYTPSPYTTAKVANQWRFNACNPGIYLVGALAWVLPPESARAILEDLDGLSDRDRGDAIIGKWAQNSGRLVWYHTPSLAQHIGLGNSALGDQGRSSLRFASDYVGDDVVPLTLAMKHRSTVGAGRPKLQ